MNEDLFLSLLLFAPFLLAFVLKSFGVDLSGSSKLTPQEIRRLERHSRNQRHMR